MKSAGIMWLAIFLGFYQTAYAEKNNPPTLEIRSKDKDKIYVKIRDGGRFISSDVSCNRIGPNGTKAFNVDLTTDTELFIYKVSPCLDTCSEPFKVYKFAKYKTIYVTWDNNVLYPQTGPLKGLGGKTVTGLSLNNNVSASRKKESDIKDHTDVINLEKRYFPDNQSKPLVGLDALWEKNCSPEQSGGPSQPNSLFCAAGYGNPFAMLILRLRFVIPQVEEKFDPNNHWLKLIGDNLPPQPEIDLKKVYEDLLGNKSQKNEIIQWKDFDDFVNFFNKSKTLAEYLNKAFMHPYGLSTENLFTQEEKTAQAQKLSADATKALTGWFCSAPSFPATSIVEKGKYLSPGELFEKKCKGSNNGDWNGTLFCAIGDGNLSATYLAQIAFVKPKIAFPKPPEEGKEQEKAIHAISMILNAFAPPGSWLEKGIGFQLGSTIKKLNDEKAPELTWEDLRNTLITRIKDFTETVPARGNKYLKPYGLEIAE